jgi:hypothetical protein
MLPAYMTLWVTTSVILGAPKHWQYIVIRLFAGLPEETAQQLFRMAHDIGP